MLLHPRLSERSMHILPIVMKSPVRIIVEFLEKMICYGGCFDK